MPTFKLTLTKNAGHPDGVTQTPDTVVYSQIFDDPDFDPKELIASLNKPVRRRKQKAAKA